VYLARTNTPYSEAYADLDLPASPYELLDALDKLRLDEGEAPYLQINEYYDFDGTAILLVEHMDEYILTPDLSSPQETAVDQLRFLLDDAAAEQLIPHVNLFTYGNEVIQHDNAALTPYGLLHRADYQPMQTPVKENMNMKM
jgi:hypothetical protein